MSYEFTIIIPVFNEELNLERVEKELKAYLKISLKKASVLFINDGSTDNSQEIIEDICQRNKGFNFIKFKQNNGLSAAIKAGFDHSTTPFIGYIDADLQTSPEDFNLLLAHCHKYDLVTGVRTKRKDTFIKNTSSVIGNSFRRVFTQDGMTDTGCPLKVIKADIAKKIPLFKGFHRFLPAMVLLQKGTILQIPIRHFPRLANVSNFGLRNRLLGPFIDCFVYLWMKKKYINYNIEKKG